jgi:hypothetical protein
MRAASGGAGDERHDIDAIDDATRGQRDNGKCPDQPTPAEIRRLTRRIEPPILGLA